jgi:hypothetical protein
MKRRIQALLPSLVLLLGSIAAAAPQLEQVPLPDDEIVVGAEGQISRGGGPSLSGDVFTVVAGERLRVGGLVAQCARRDSVTLTVKGAPPNTQPSFSVNPVPSNQSFAFFLQTQTNTPLGTYMLRIRGNGPVCGRYNPYIFQVRVKAS